MLQQNQFDELPTRYDLYYFKWNLYKHMRNMDHIQAALDSKSVTEQTVENYYYYLLVAFKCNVSWNSDCDYDILTDYDQPRTLTRSKTHILDYRGKKFDPDEAFGNRYLENEGFEESDNDYLNDEHTGDDDINYEHDEHIRHKTLNKVPPSEFYDSNYDLDADNGYYDIVDIN
jgi:hypothetical protein